jgi:hypothetical protein
MHLFDAASVSGDARGWQKALTEALAEVQALKTSLKASQQRESIWRARAEGFERMARRR